MVTITRDKYNEYAIILFLLYCRKKWQKLELTKKTALKTKMILKLLQTQKAAVMKVTLR